MSVEFIRISSKFHHRIKVDAGNMLESATHIEDFLNNNEMVSVNDLILLNKYITILNSASGRFMV